MNSQGPLRRSAVFIGALVASTAVASGGPPGDIQQGGQDQPVELSAQDSGLRSDENENVRPAQAAMRELAEKTMVEIADDERQRTRKAVWQKEPVVSYGDETRAIKDSTLWVWRDGEQPAAFQKLEVNDWSPTFAQWTYCFASASRDVLGVSWAGVRKGTRTSGGVTYQTVPKEPKPAPKASVWPLQARSLSRDFSVFAVSGEKHTSLRLMPKPVLEFRAPQQGTPYGAVFAYALGTNPDVLLVLQIEEDAAGNRQWTYAPLHMTSARIKLTHDGEALWDDPRQDAGTISTWGYFFTPRDPALQ